VIKLTQVAQFVHNHVVGQLGRQQSDFVVKIQVSLFTATSPPGFGIFYGDAINFETVKFVIVGNPAFC